MQPPANEPARVVFIGAGPGAADLIMCAVPGAWRRPKWCFSTP